MCYGGAEDANAEDINYNRILNFATMQVHKEDVPNAVKKLRGAVGPSSTNVDYLARHAMVEVKA